MPQDAFPELDKAKTDSGSGDAFPELDAGANKGTKGFDFAGAAKAGMGNLGAAAASFLPGLAEIPEELTNLQAYMGRRIPGLDPVANALFGTMGAPNLQDTIRMSNKLAGAPAQPYMDVTGAMMHNPALGGGKTPAQLAQQYPVGGAIGNLAGQLPAFMLGGEAAGISKLPMWGRIAASGAEGAAIGSGTAAMQEAGTEAKINDQLNPQAIAGEAASNFLPGLVFGAGTRAIGEGIGAGMRRLFPETLPPLPGAPEPKRIGGSVLTPETHRLPAPPKEPEAQMGKVDVHIMPDRTSPPEPKRIEQKLTTPTLADRAKMENELYVPPFKHTEEVHGEIIKPSAQSEPETKVAPKPLKKGEMKVTMDEPLPHKEVVEARIEEIVDPDKSWRGAREDAARPVTAQEAPLARDLARNKINMDAIGAKLKGALRQIYKDLNLAVPKRAKQLDPKYALEMKQIAADLGGTPVDMSSAVESTISPRNKFPETHEFRATTLAGKIEEVKALDKEYRSAKTKYENFKDRHEEDFSEKFPLNETIQVTVQSKEFGERSVNIRRRWQPTEYEFPTPEAKAKFDEKKATRIAKSVPYHELTTPAFIQTVNKVLDKGTHLEIENLADMGAFTWFKSLGKSNQAKIVLTIGATAAAYAGTGQQAEAAPSPQLVGNVVKKLAKNGWKEWMGSRPITALTKLDMTTDMIRRGFDDSSKKFFTARMQYLAELKRANVGARTMTDAEKEAVAGMPPRDLRRTDKLQGWTAQEKQKAGDIAYLNQQYREKAKAELNRLDGIGVQPGRIKQANRYARGVQIDAQDMGIDLGNAAPLGKSSEMVDKLTGEITKSTFLGNFRVAIYHFHEALTASISKYPGAFARAVHGLMNNPTYREFAIANSPHGFFQQMLEGQTGFAYRQKIDRAINEPIDNLLKKVLGQAGYDVLSAQLPERAKLGLNAVTIAEEVAKNYPDGGPERYMKDWLAAAKNRTDIPAHRQEAFAKAALESLVEENIATGSLPDGPIKERTVFQRTKVFSLLIAYTRGKIQQSRFVFSLMDDALAAIAEGDGWGTARALRGLIVANLMIFGAAGSAAVPPYIWSALEQIDRVEHGNTNTVLDIKDKLDAAQKNIGPGYQIPHLGLAGAPVTTMPSGAISGFAQQVRFPKNREQLTKDAVDLTTLTLLSRLGPSGLVNMRYMAEKLYQGMTNKENFRQYEEGIANILAAKAAGKPTKLLERPLPFGLGEGVLHAFAPVENPQEVAARQQAERRSAKNWPRNVKKTQTKLRAAFKK